MNAIIGAIPPLRALLLHHAATCWERARLCLSVASWRCCLARLGSARLVVGCWMPPERTEDRCGLHDDEHIGNLCGLNPPSIPSYVSLRQIYPAALSLAVAFRAVLWLAGSLLATAAAINGGLGEEEGINGLGRRSFYRPAGGQLPTFVSEGMGWWLRVQRTTARRSIKSDTKWAEATIRRKP